MTVKTSGAQWKVFYNDPFIFAGESWHEDAIITINGKEEDDNTDLSAVEDTAVMTIKGGAVYLNGELQEMSLEKYFKAFLDAQEHAFLLFKVHKDRLEAVKSAAEAAGGQLV